MEESAEVDFSSILPQEEKVYDYEQLLNISKALNSNLDINALMASLIDNILAHAHTLKIGIFMHPDVEHSDFVVNENYLGFEFEDREKMVIPGKCALTKFLLNYNSNTISLEELKKIATDENLDFGEPLEILESAGEDLMLITLKTKGKVVGLIFLGQRSNRESFADREKAFLSNIGTLAAIAIENARLYQLATVDMMTKLKIHHFFQTRLREEIENSRDEGTDLSMLLTDIDHFKKFNDTYGHQLGDLVLQKVAEIIIKLSGIKDVPSRYGGEEFALIMPGASLETAKLKAEEIRAAIEELEVENPTATGDRILKVTISIGVACFDEKIDRVNKDLIERCDKALYRAKHGGRNQVAVSEGAES